MRKSRVTKKNVKEYIYYCNENRKNIDLSNLILEDADLSLVEVYNGNFANTNLNGSNLSSSLFSNCNFAKSSLRNCNLNNTNFSSSNLYYSFLNNSNLCKAKLNCCNMSFCSLLRCLYNKFTEFPSTNQMLSCSWKELSSKLTLECMRYDAASIPNGKELFRKWKKNGTCPFVNCQFNRPINFYEKRYLYVEGRTKSSVEILKMLMKECMVFVNE